MADDDLPQLTFANVESSTICQFRRASRCGAEHYFIGLCDFSGKGWFSGSGDIGRNDDQGSMPWLQASALGRVVLK